MSEIFYIQSYDLKANIGGAYNRHIQHLPDDCWIVISDHDSNFLIPDFGKQLHDIIEKHGNEYALLGCVTNRLRGKHQLYKNEFSNDFELKNHFQIACELYKGHYAEVEETSGIAGVMMMFKKSTWQAVGEFEQMNVACDTAFNKAVKAKGLGKIGIMKGVYVFHCYRMWQSNHQLAANDVQHLIKK
jgi:hypothetical protein